ncbi:peptidase C19 family protein [Tieghemostelium lacteum]|uniref:Peptidase C19 family protein n=1 Tax=Tieghemostelium lacteum TaxID=361077 RepID=A0A151Z2T6_TIELA|nr:peptidase C19 family protein [Tieghemostelium lacteum]|eukprot:KYQ88273.1 peptidase C19 family protein [Tieghemostelium lacteum]
MFGNLYGDEDDVNHGGSNSTTTNYNSNTAKKQYMRKPTEKRSPYGFVGLLNQGATCYLNSLIQLLYMTPELKNELYTLTLEDFGLEPEKQPENKVDIEEISLEQVKDKQDVNSSNNSNSGGGGGVTTTTTTTTTTSVERPTNRSLIPTSGINHNKRIQQQQQQEEEFDYSILESDYFQNLLNFGFEEHKLIEGLKKFPHEHQQERLVDWILSWEDRVMMQHVSEENDAAAIPLINNGMGPMTREQYESLASLTESDIYNRIPEESNSSKSENFDAFFSNFSNEDNSSKAIVLYDENQNNLLTPLLTPSLDSIEINNTTTTSNNNNSSVIDLVNPTTQKKANKKKGRRISYELQRLFSLLQSGNVFAISTEDLTKSFGWTDNQSLYQHDIHELNRILFDAIEHSIKNTKIEDIFNQLYKGSNIIRIVCQECKTVRDREEFYLDMPVSVKGSQSVEESLSAFVTPEMLDGKNQYFCETCQKKVNASYGQRIGKLPPILHMHLNRFDYDAQKGKRVKLHNRFEFSNSINMTPYTADYNTYELKLADYKSLNPDATSEDLEKFKTANKPKDKIYDLFAVLIHSGGAFGGHYHSYIKDLLTVGKHENSSVQSHTDNQTSTKDVTSVFDDEKDEKSSFNRDQFSSWFDFNDSQVTPIKDRAIINQFGGKSECAYMLIYRDRENNNPELLKPVDIPKHFDKEIHQFNTNLENQRYTYEKTINSMFLQPRFLEDFVIRDGYLYENPKELDAIQQLETDHLQLQIDVSSTVDDLYVELDRKYPEQVSKLGGPGNYVIQEITVKNGQVTNIQPAIQPNSQLNIKKCGLREGSQFIIWRGEEYAGLPAKPLQYQIKFYQGTSGNTKIFPLAIGKDKKFSDLLQQVSGLLEIPVDKLLIYSQSNSSLILMEDDIDTSISNRIYQAQTLLVEEKVEGQCLILTDHELNKNKIQLFVKDKFHDFTTQKEYGRVLIDPKSSVYQLKGVILDELFTQLEKTEWIEKTIIRKTATGGFEGTACSDDSMNLKDLNINDSSLIIFEKGTPTKSQVIVRYQLYIDKQCMDVEPHQLSIPKASTFLQLKKKMLESLNINTEYSGRYVLRACDIFEKPTHIIGDEDQTIEESGLSQSDLLVIEEGVLPTKDQIPLFIRIYHASQEPILLQFPSSPVLHLNPTYIPPIPDLYQLHNIGQLMVDRKQNLLAFKLQILKWDKFINQQVVPFNPQQQDIRLWLDEKLLSLSNKPLSKLHIQPEATITVEVFKHLANNTTEQQSTTSDTTSTTTEEVSDNQSSSTSTSTSKSGNLPPLLLYVHKRKPQEQCFEHPPKQVIFNGKLISELVTLVSKEFDIEEQYVRLFKFSPNQKINPWRTVEEKSQQQMKQEQYGLSGNSSTIADSSPAAESGFIYGISLETLMDRQKLDAPTAGLPLILTQFVQQMVLLNAMEFVDLFSDKMELQWLELEKVQIDQNPMEMTKINNLDLLAMLFKEWLKDLPVPMIPDRIWPDLVVSIEDIEDPWDTCQKQMTAINSCVLNFIFDFLVEFLHPDNDKQSQREIRQMTIDLAPALLQTNDRRYFYIIESLLSHKLKGIQQFENDADVFLGKNNSKSNSSIEKSKIQIKIDDGDVNSSSSLKIIDDYENGSTTSSTTTTTTTTNTGSVPPPPPPMMSKKKGTKNENQGQKVTNELRGKPYLLKDGDIISFLDSRDDPENNDKFAMTTAKFDNFSTRYSKVSNGEKYTLGGVSRSYKPKEVDLKIELDDYE